jgi:hypothetical protein
MRGVRSTLALLAVLIGLGAYIYFVESKREPATEGAANRIKLFGDLDGSKIAEVTIKTQAGESATLEKADGKWRMTAPVKASADEVEVTGLTNSLGTLETERIVEENPADLNDFGLATPKADISFRPEGAKEMRRLLIGDKTATGGDIYAKLADEKRVFLIPGYLETSFTKTPFDFRDKTVLAVERDKVDAIEIGAGDAAVRAVKANNLWRLQKPWDAPADFSAVESIVTRLSTGQMKSIVSEEGADLGQYGLERPALTASVGAGSSRATLAIGTAAPGDGQVYAKDASRPMVFTVEAALLDDLKKSPADLRRKEMFDFRPFNANRVELTRGADSVVFEKTRDEKAGTDKWRRVQPNAADVESAKMDALLTALSNLRAESFAASGSGTDLKNPVLTAAVKFDDGKKEERVIFARSGADVLASAGEPAPPSRLDAKLFDEAVKALDAIAK